MRLIFLLGLGACASDYGWQGTGVGNPGSQFSGDEASFSVPQRSRLQWTEATLQVKRWTLEGCSGEDAFLDFEQAEVDLLASQPVPVPQGSWCRSVIELDGPVLLHGTFTSVLWANPGVIDLELDAMEIVHEGPIVLPGEASVVELASPNWLGLDTLGEVTGGNMSVHPGDLAHPLLAQRIALGSGWFVDTNTNHQVDTNERDRGPIAAGENWTSEYRYDHDND